MRRLLGAAVTAAPVIAAWWAFALAGAAQLASAASRGDVGAVAERVDVRALARSLSGQIAHAFLDDNPRVRALAPMERGFVGGAGDGAAEALLREALTPENLAAILAGGRVRFPGAGDAGWRMPPYGDLFHDGLLRVLGASRFEGPLRFVVGLDGPDGRTGVHLRLDGTTWRLAGLDLPEAVGARLARAIADRLGERGGG